MIDVIITMIFVALVVSIWLLRNNVEKDLKEMSEERPPVVILTKNEFESENVRINNEPVVNNVYAESDIETQQPPISISGETTETGPAAFTDDNGTDVYEEKVIGDEIPDNNIVEEPAKEIEEESVEPEEPKKEIPVVDYASIADYFSGKLNTPETVNINSEEKEVAQEQAKESETVVWRGDAL